MKTEIITCDCCLRVIPDGGGWENSPGLVVFSFGYPEQNNITTSLPHVCYSCRYSLKAGIKKIIGELRPPSETTKS